jgi:hypothetical protein
MNMDKLNEGELAGETDELEETSPITLCQPQASYVVTWD